MQAQLLMPSAATGAQRHQFAKPGAQGRQLRRRLLQIGPGAATIFGQDGAFAARTDGIDTTGIERHDRLESEITDPLVDEVVEVAEVLPSMEA